MMLSVMARTKGVDVTPITGKSVMSSSHDPDGSCSTLSETSSHSDDDEAGLGSNSNISNNSTTLDHGTSRKDPLQSFVGSFLKLAEPQQVQPPPPLPPLPSREDDSIDSISNNQNQNNSNNTKNGSWNMMKRLQQASHSAKVSSHIATLKAGLTLWDREMKILKEAFGVECYDIMERNRNIGECSGGETDPEVVEVFVTTVHEMNALYDVRNRKLTQLTQERGEVPLMCAPENKSTDTNNNSHSTATTIATTTTMTERLRLAQQSYLAYSSQAAIKDDLKRIDHEIEMVKQKFGIHMFDTMFAINMMGEDETSSSWQPRDSAIQEVYRQTKDKILPTYQKRERANREINDLECTGVILVTQDEIRDYIQSNSTLYAMLSVVTGKSQKECVTVAVRVAMELISQQRGEAAQTAILTRQNFQQHLVQAVVENPQPGALKEFLYRCMFAAFDQNTDGFLDESEVNQFLDAFYQSGPIFQGDSRLSQKAKFKELIWEQLVVLQSEEEGRGQYDNASGTGGQFAFEQLHQVTSGSTKCNRRRNVHERRDGSPTTPTTTLRQPPIWTVLANDLIVNRLTSLQKNKKDAEEAKSLDEEQKSRDEKEAEDIVFLYEKERKY
jgi:hypothetical protein